MAFALVTHLNEIAKLKDMSDKIIDDNPGSLAQKVRHLSQCLTYIGRVSSHLDGEYKKIYATRKLEFSKAYIAATSHREANAEIAIAPLRELESQAYEDMQRWRNAFDSTKEEINSLKMKLKIDFHLGGE